MRDSRIQERNIKFVCVVYVAFVVYIQFNFEKIKERREREGIQTNILKPRRIFRTPTVKRCHFVY